METPGAAPQAVPVIPPLPPHDPRGRDNNFNFLRLVFASLVLLSHSMALVDGDGRREIFHRIFHRSSLGEIAVDGFFLLSGFLILQSWHRQPDLASFVQKRVLRIYPGFVVACLVSGLIVGPLAADVSTYFQSFKTFQFLFALVCLRGVTVPETFAGLPFPGVNNVMWTISHEFRCYLLVPLLASLGLVKHRIGWLVFSLVILGCAAIQINFPYPFMTGKVWFNLLPGVPSALPRLLAFFCLGGCFYLFRRELKYRAGWAVGMLAVLVPCLFYDGSAQVALATAGAYALFCFAFARIRFLKIFQSHSDVSCGVYLYGWPTQKLLLWHFPHLSPWTLFVESLVLCLGIGFVSWHAVELPFLRLKPRHDPRDVTPPLASG